MKLLGGILQRGSKTRSESNDSNMPGSSNHHSKSNSHSPFRRTKLQKPPFLHGNAMPTRATHRRHESHNSRSDVNSVFSLPAQGYDDLTVDDANTLFDWSVADNAPSIGSVADLFQDTGRPRQDDDTLVGVSSAGNSKRSQHSKRRNNIISKKKRDDNASSSDEEDEVGDDDEDENVLEQHFQYCKLSDSPPRRQGTDHECVDNTPIRKGKSGHEGETSVHATENTSSPSRVKKKRWRNGASAYPLQGLRNVVASKSGTEKRLEESRVVQDERKLCAELKGRIHAVEFKENDRSYDQSIRSSVASPSASVDDASIANVGNANSPFRHVPVVRGKLEDLSMFDSTRNLGDMNESPRKMYARQVSEPAPEPEPEFTFSVTHEDLFGSDVESTWLLNNGDSSDDSSVASDHNHGNETNRKIDTLQDRDAAAKEYRSSRTFATDGAVVYDEGGNLPIHWKNDNKEGSTVRNHNKFRKKVKDQMKNKIQSIVKKKNRGHDVSSQCAVGSQMDKPKLKRLTSELSMAPLTGIEEHSRLRLGKSKKDKEVLKEVERRKEIERRDIARRMKQRKEREELEKMRKKQTIDVDKWKAQAAECKRPNIYKSDPMDDASKRKLQTWITGNPKEKHVEIPHHGNSCDTPIAIPQQNYAPVDAQKFQKITQLSAHDKQLSTITGRSNHTCSTTRIDNTTKPGMSRHINNVPDFDPYFSDEEDSAAQTPEASAPLTHDFLCVVCKNGERTHLAVPCMHFSFCGDCVSILEKQPGDAIRCSVCNEKAEKFSKVFY